MIEVEIKAKINDPEEIKSKLKNLGARYLVSLEHKDTYYNMPRKLRDFRKTDEALRIRESKEFKTSNPNDGENQFKYYLTYKGEKIDDQTKTRKELEVKFENVENLKEILDTLNFRDIITVKKKRDLYEIIYDDNKIECLIDYLPILDQFFIEVEVIVELKEQVSQKTKELFSFLKELNIEKSDSIRKSYLELIVEKLQSN
ncbi:MAG: class IV adenylate cyclase [Candidatus Lokiarchaeota archaeon]